MNCAGHYSSFVALKESGERKTEYELCNYKVFFIQKIKIGLVEHF